MAEVETQLQKAKVNENGGNAREGRKNHEHEESLW